MFCPNCGTDVQNESQFCPNCGSSLNQNTYQNDSFSNSQSSNFGQNQFNNTQSGFSNPMTAQSNSQPMGWFKFLIYFALFASAAVNLYSGILFLTGAQYDGGASYVYLTFPSLKTVDILVGIISIAASAIAILGRFQLAAYKKNGPIFVYLLYVISILINLIYMIAIFSILGRYANNINFTTNIMSIIVGVVMLIVNIIYFNKRKNIFIK